MHCIPRGLELLAGLLTDEPFVADDILASEAPPEELVRQLVGRGWGELDETGRAVVGLLAPPGRPCPPRRCRRC